MKVAVFSTRQYDRTSLREAIPAGCQLEFSFLEVNLDQSTTPLAAGHDAICLFVNDVCDEPIIDHLLAHGVKYITLRAAGFNNVNVAYADKVGIKVARVPAYSPEAVAEFTVGMILTIVRKYHKSYNRVREGNFLLDGLMGFNLSGKTVGIVGTGKIGLITGRILSKGFNCKVIAYDLYHNEAAAEHGITYVETLEGLLNQSDIVSLHCPLLEGTKYLINDNTLGQMKRGAILINTSRGGLIDTYALIRALKSGHIAAVGLDVFEREKTYFFADSSDKVIHDDSFARLLSFYNVFMTGHQAFLTKEALQNIAETTIKNLMDMAATGTCANLVKPSD